VRFDDGEDASQRTGPMNDSADIFLSYSQKDKDQVRPLLHALEHHGFFVWWDHNVSPGRDFDIAIETALAAARCVVVVWTAHSVASRNRAHPRDVALGGAGSSSV